MANGLSVSAASDEHEADDPNAPNPGHPQDADRLPDSDLEAAYRAMAEDEPGEAEALEWIEATIGDIAG